MAVIARWKAVVVVVGSGSIVKLFKVENSHPVLSSGSFPLLDTYNTSEFQMKISMNIIKTVGVGIKNFKMATEKRS